jgi:hypothetical protein
MRKGRGNMKYGKIMRCLLLGVCFLACPLPGRAQEYQTTAFQLSLLAPAQLFPDSFSVEGFRLDLIYGANEDLKGIDMGLINNSNGNAHGLELGAVNLVGKDFGGVQFGLFNEDRRNVNGVQLGLINVTRLSFEGFQAAALYNDAQEDMHGLQLGIVNHAGSLNGIQIGLLNFNDDHKELGFLPFINAAF